MKILPCKVHHLIVLLAVCLIIYPIGLHAVGVRDGFETSELSDVWSAMRIDAEGYRFVTEPIREGQQAIEITLRPGAKSDVGKDNKKTERAELTDASHLRSSMGEEAWYGFSFYIPNDVLIPDSRVVLAQWKQACEDCTLKHHPIVSLRLGSGKLRVYAQNGREKMKLYKERHPLQGRWIDMTFGLKPSLEGNGMLQVFLNGEQIVSYTGSLGYPDDKPEVYFKMGVYRDATLEPMRIIFDDYRRGDTLEEITAQLQ